RGACLRLAGKGGATTMRGVESLTRRRTKVFRRPECPGFSARLPVLASLLIPMALVFHRPVAAADDRVGVNAAVNPAGTGTPPLGPTRQLVIGQDVVFRERVNTVA